MNMLTRCYDRFSSMCKALPEDAILLLARVAIASVFWRSVQTKITGWEAFGQSWQFFNLSPSTVMLFQYEYQLPLLAPQLAAYMGTTAEFFLPLLLVLGFGTRFAALGLLGVTAVIQFLVLPDGWPTHILWFAILFYLLKHGGGRVALDPFVFRSTR